MTQTRTVLPGGYREIGFPALDSTNAEALRRAGQGEAGRLWVRADTQSAGRGRSGRQWRSESGNLFASLLLRPDCVLETAVQLAFVAGLAAFDAVVTLAAKQAGHLQLKWPNDLLLERRKIGGVLIESMPASSGERDAIVIGTGLNLASHPTGTSLPATDLASQGVEASATAAFEALAASTAHWIETWGDGEGWPTVRRSWEERSLPKGAAIRVNTGGSPVTGKIAGIDARGALLVDTGTSAPVIVTAGDVFLL